MRGGITLWCLPSFPPLPSCLAPPECCRSVPFYVPSDPQSHINKGGGSSIRGCYALYLHDARDANEMRKDPAVFSFYLSFSHFVKLQIPANTCRYLIVFVRQTYTQIMRQTCSKSPDANHHANKANQSICLARVLIPIRFVLDYLPDILQLSRN